MLRFTDVISPHHMTQYVVPRLLTVNEHVKAWIHGTSLINIYNQAGFETYWFSNQEFVRKSSQLFPALYTCCTHYHFTRYGSDDVDSPYDGVLVPMVQKYCLDNQKKKFLVIHLMGSHFAYPRRYPHDFSFFSPKDVKNAFGENKTVAEYLNSIRYNDHVIHQLIHLFADKNAIVLYLPDHGEEVDDIYHFSGRSIWFTKNMFEIPFYLWLSPLFMERNPGKKEELSQYVDRPYLTSSLAHALMDISGVQSDKFDATKSIFNARYEKMDNRMVMGVNYDTELKNKRVKVKQRLGL